MLSSANAFEMSDHQFKPANPTTECDNVTCPADGEITIRQPQVACDAAIEEAVEKGEIMESRPGRTQLQRNSLPR
jgi:hypothetical protein